MAIVSGELISEVNPYPELLVTPETVTDADGLRRLHSEACERAQVRREDGSAELRHEDDASFTILVGNLENGDLFIGFGNNQGPTLLYSIRDKDVYQHVKQGDKLSPGINISDNQTEIAAVGNILQKGK